MNVPGDDVRRGRAARVVMLSMMATAILGGCAAGKDKGSTPAPAAKADTMTMAEMRLNEAGGPSRTVMPEGIASPVAAPTPPGPRALTDAGANTPLGKQWVFTRIGGYDGALPGPPKNASLLMSRGNGRVAGSTSCNPLTASFEINVVSATLSFRNIASGRAMCGKPNVDVEDAVIDAMRVTDSFVMDGKNLTLKSKGSAVAELTTP